MEKPLSLLIVEDSEDDALMALRELKKAGYDITSERVESADALKDVLEKQEWDIIISDYAMPHFNGMDALEIYKKTGIDIPFIIVSGRIGEETAVELMKAGAHDYIMKSNMLRLAPAIERELNDANTRRQHKQAQIELIESEERFRSVIESAPISVIVSSTCTIISWNPTSEEMFGYKEDEVLGKPITMLMPERFREVHEKAMQRIIKSGTLPKRLARNKEYVGLRKDGAEFPLELSVACWKIKDELFFSGIIHDITERKQAEEIRLDNMHLKYANSAKTEFISSVSHDLRSPLNSIIGFSELLIKNTVGSLNEKQEHYVDNVIVSSKHLLDLINDILDISKVEAGKIELLIEKIPLAASIDETLMLMSEKAMKHSIKINKQYDPDIDLIEVDKRRLKQILINLFDNAMKFSKTEGGTITVTTKKEGDFVRISISDTGIGIKKEEMSKLFKKFEQLTTTRQYKYEGTGLGLAISKQLVELHGGEIEAKSTFGKGTEFTFKLPIKATKEVKH